MAAGAPPLQCTRRQADAPWSSASSTASSPFKESSRDRQQQRPRLPLPLRSLAKSSLSGPPLASLSRHASLQ
jgi:hypothetical protein